MISGLGWNRAYGAATVGGITLAGMLSRLVGTSVDEQQIWPVLALGVACALTVGYFGYVAFHMHDRLQAWSAAQGGLLTAAAWCALSSMAHSMSYMADRRGLEGAALSALNEYATWLICANMGVAIACVLTAVFAGRRAQGHGMSGNWVLLAGSAVIVIMTSASLFVQAAADASRRDWATALWPAALAVAGGAIITMVRGCASPNGSIRWAVAVGLGVVAALCFVAAVRDIVLFLATTDHVPSLATGVAFAVVGIVCCLAAKRSFAVR